jgi:hypothetical protein
MQRCRDCQPPRYAVAHWRLVACLWAALLVSGCGSPTSPEQQAALGKIQALGGKVSYEHGGYKVDLVGSQVADADLEHLTHVQGLRELDLRGTRVTDAGLKHLQAVATLEVLNLQRTAVTNEGVAQLKGAKPALYVVH